MADTALQKEDLLLNPYATPLPVTQPLNSHYHTAATSDNTRRAYQADIRHFEQWGGQLPATTDSILRYLHAFAPSLNPRTLSRRITALSQWHRYQQFYDPTQAPMVRKTLIGIARLHGKPKEKASPLLPEDVIKMVRYLEAHSTLRATRDSALIQVGFLGALRRSELAAMRIEHLDWQAKGIEILIPGSKTDPLHAGQHGVIPYGNAALCAVTALKAWIEQANIQDGFIFRRLHRNHTLSELPITPHSVNIMVKEYAVAAGLEHAQTMSSHSLRRGLATTASRAGVALPIIMRQGRWKQVSTVLEYIEAAQRFEDNAAGQVLQALVAGVKRE